MRFLIAAIALLMLGFLGLYSGYAKEAQGELRCEGAGAVIINVDGKDYAVNGMAGRRYPPIERVWNNATHPDADIGRTNSTEDAHTKSMSTFETEEHLQTLAHPMSSPKR